ncbi:phage shock protein B [Sphingomonas sp. SORGH_AS 950]|uniref:envelope stress response membrane protein PspB n=1 Tax=unclassified Sphingomonas TaxID=196159 RepID=UPI002785A516|nr:MULTISPECIES: envelope stress response membrane protein PspB [unclassified Sphingomonas]MDQ1156831.1 phage shock protein B [Sphingomonas sp. SORGH_AS_0950]MDR6115310.1 phage shock protein B [Sphingomonas sp. SORGH_AS_0789]MDR6147225.1 phage shock protein B [Sphingomonas sp. SORGH_AS_0870]MDR6151015.1 phage shock protein B [Sphingomonas sp. SORGH_AS_0742]
MDDVAVPFILFGSLFVALPWLILHYVTKWKQAPKITHEDEQLLDELHMLARRLEDRLHTVERIVAADNPNFKPGLSQSEWRSESRLGQHDYSLDRRN